MPAEDGRAMPWAPEARPAGGSPETAMADAAG